MITIYTRCVMYEHSRQTRQSLVKFTSIVSTQFELYLGLATDRAGWGFIHGGLSSREKPDNNDIFFGKVSLMLEFFLLMPHGLKKRKVSITFYDHSWNCLYKKPGRSRDARSHVREVPASQRRVIIIKHQSTTISICPSIWPFNYCQNKFLGQGHNG